MRRVIRDQLFVPWLEQQGYFAIHSAAFANTLGDGTLVVGQGGSGKTTFFVSALAQRSYRMLSTDRTLVKLTDEGILALGVPEAVNFLPGTLAQFPELRDLSESSPAERFWARNSKFHVPWRLLYGRFAAQPSHSKVLLKRIVFPEYGAQWECRTLSPAETREKLEEELLTADRDLPVPNWMEIYKQRDTSAETLLESMSHVHAEAVRWNGVSEISRYLAHATRPERESVMPLGPR
ncbi:hypothetical protein BHK69_30880 (plasmid) [Bosea vaviloviae]|uniref:Uncharacterized protein n=1 Tax=Bosea vaviloviae TaxID=1526658 RepID=A0A1D7UCK8_9HYPH|nr:hypothetical protein BHK69_30880 [Bosea vaviloviae]